MSELQGVDPDVILRLLQAASEVLSDMRLEDVRERLLAAAREACGARYAALDLDASRRELERLITGEAGASELSEADEPALLLLAGFAGVAIDYARRLSEVQRRQRELERSVAALDATVQIARSIGGETDLSVILELVAQRGRALVSGRALVIELEQGGEMLVAAVAGEVPADLVGQSVDQANSLASLAVRGMGTLRLEDEPNLRRFRKHGLGRLGFTATAGLVVPLIFRGTAHGALIAIDRLEGGPAFSEEDQVLLEAFAASAATAVATARSVEADRRSQRLAAAEQERSRWARELHDETLQNLAALRLGICAQLRSDDLPAMKSMLAESLESLEEEIASLRSLIHELRPTALDDLGLGAALEDLAGRAAARGVTVELDSDLAYEQGREPTRHHDETETAVYRIVQEALTNAVKHGGATRAFVRLRDDHGVLTASIEDDGSGFDTGALGTGFGLTSMRERAELAGGTLDVRSQPGSGTTVEATIPARRIPRAIAS